MTFKTIRNVGTPWATTINVTAEPYQESESAPIFLNFGARTALEKTIDWYEQHPYSCGADAYNYLKDEHHKPLSEQKPVSDEIQKQAQDIIEFWGFNFMQERLAGFDKFTRWQEGVINLVKDPIQPVSESDLKIIVTLPKYTIIQRKLNDLVEKYQPWDGSQGGGPTNLKLVDVIERGSKGRRSKTCYAFVDDRNQLMFMEFFNGENSTVFVKALLDKMLSDNDLEITAEIKMSYQMIGRDFAVGKIYDISNIQ